MVEVAVESHDDGGNMADSGEAAVTGQTATVGYFDDAPATDQVVSRAVAAQQDLAVRTQTLANRAPDLLARIGDLRDDEPVTVTEPVVVPDPAPAPTPAPAADPVAVAAEPAGPVDPLDALARLRSLATMLDEGLIDQTEFDAKKAEILTRL